LQEVESTGAYLKIIWEIRARRRNRDKGKSWSETVDGGTFTTKIIGGVGEVETTAIDRITPYLARQTGRAGGCIFGGGGAKFWELFPEEPARRGGSRHPKQGSGVTG